MRYSRQLYITVKVIGKRTFVTEEYTFHQRTAVIGKAIVNTPYQIFTVIINER